MTTPLETRLHRGARIEDAVMARVARLLWRRGWRPQVVVYPSYGATSAESDDGPEDGWVRALARVRLRPPDMLGPEPDPLTQPVSAVVREGARWWRKFLTVGLADVNVRFQLGEREYEVLSGRGGYIDIVLPAALPSGWHEITAEVQWRERVGAAVRVVGPDERWGLVSDIDDTVMITALPRPLLAFWNTFVVRETNRQAVPGMAALYRRLRTEEPDALVVYLSTGAWNVAEAIANFLERQGYPQGPLLMTDWGPTNNRWFRSGQAHKHRELRRLVSDFPQLRWVLVGDDGQHDPQLYESLADEVPAAVRMVLIRQLVERGTGAHARQSGGPREPGPGGPQPGPVGPRPRRPRPLRQPPPKPFSMIASSARKVNVRRSKTRHNWRS